MESYRDITIYDLNTYFLLVGHTKSSPLYKLLKIRKLPNTLEIQEVKRTFTENELESYLKSILSGSGRQEIVKANVVLGVIKFLQGFYLFIVTEKYKVAMLRGKSVYKVKSTKLLKLFPEKKTKDEKHYIEIFKTLDLTSGFYFSYSYDLTHTLQENIVKSLQSTAVIDRSRARAKTFYSFNSGTNVNFDLQGIYDWKSMFVWNHDMISNLYSILTDKNWLVPLIHGFVGYKCVTIVGKKYDIVVISRRSRFFAGTRYLKRGLSEDGKVANDVETEQIVIEKIPNGKISSFTQHRGSVPLFWCQDPTSVLPSPPIILNQNDFLHDGTIKHFSDMFSRYGSPIIIINLLRVTDKNKENDLSHEYQSCVEHLNEQIPEEFKLLYNSFDIKNEIKKSKKTYEQKFYTIFKEIIAKTSVFTAIVHGDKTECSLQLGVIRTNCVDCIDRTNEGQLLVSHLALENQLKQLGISESLSKKSDIIQVLTELFEKMGDAIALQYSGSIAHKAANSKEKSKQNKILVATQRHLANLTKDPKKQQAINLFLGIYKTDLYPMQLWEISDDFRLHNKVEVHSRIYGKWWKYEIQKYWGRLGLTYEKTENLRFSGQNLLKNKQMLRTRVFACDKALLSGKQSMNISSFDKKYLTISNEVIEIVITEEESIENNEDKKPVEKPKAKIKKRIIEVSPDEIELFGSYAELAEINTKDNFHLTIVNEELHSEIKRSGQDDYHDYLNFKVNTRKLLKDYDDEEENDIKEIGIEQEVIDIRIIDEYLDEYQPPVFLKCIHYKEFHE